MVQSWLFQSACSAWTKAQIAKLARSTVCSVMEGRQRLVQVHTPQVRVWFMQVKAKLHEPNSSFRSLNFTGKKAKLQEHSP